MIYAVNIADLTKFKDDIAIKLLIIPRLKADVLYECEGNNADGKACEIEANQETVENIKDTIRMKIPKHELRIYVGSGKSWKRI